MASFYERCLLLDDYETDGGMINIFGLLCWLHQYEAGIATASQIKTHFSMTTEQGDDLDELLATMPTNLLLLVNAAPRARWADVIYSTLWLGQEGTSGYNTEAECRAILGTS